MHVSQYSSFSVTSKLYRQSIVGTANLAVARKHLVKKAAQGVNYLSGQIITPPQIVMVNDHWSCRNRNFVPILLTF